MSANGEGMERPRLSLVIPAYNEADNIRELYGEIKEALGPESYEVLIVDDSSTDGSFDILKGIAKDDHRVRAIRLKCNSGQSAALAAGFDHARGEYVITMDADLQNDPNDIPALMKKLDEGYDVVCGWRASRKDTLSKKFFSKISNVLRRVLIGETIHDSGCTLRVYKDDCISDIDLYGEMHRYIPAIMRINGYRVGEVKVNHRARRHGKTKYGWKRLLKGFSDLIAIVFWSRFATRPMHIFGITGVLISAVGIVISSYMLFMRLVFGVSLSDKPLFTLSILASLTGLQFLAFGVLADISVKTYYRQRGYKNYRVDKTVGNVSKKL